MTTLRDATIPALASMIDSGSITPDEAVEALRRAASDGRYLDTVLREVRPDVRVPGALAFPFFDLAGLQIDPAVVVMVPEALARHHCTLPICLDEDGRLVVAMSEPTNVIAIDDLRTASGREVSIVLAEPVAIHTAWRQLESLDRIGESLIDESKGQAPADRDEELDSSKDAPIVRATQQIIVQAVQQHASDLHFEPQEHDVRVRFRLDGVLHDVTHLPRSVNGGVVSRLKIMAELNIAERRVPQDGRMTLAVDGGPVDIRVATVPSMWGEEVILRILDRSSLLALEDLGFSRELLDAYEDVFHRPHGAVLVVGPTGSGKSTTLYSTLSAVNEVSRKIITVEDPIELPLEGVSQIHVNQKHGLSFATALRSILRSDPDVVMVGEIRDTETARIAIEAAMTGHLVFSTLHTNDAPSAVMRLVEMGLEPFLVASAVRGVLAQRLVRKLCERCKVVFTPAQEVLRENGIAGTDVLYRAAGCKHCAGTGYRGRVALFELMRMTEEMELLTSERATADEIRRLAVAQGMRTLKQDGVRKAIEGVTSLEEVLRVLDGRTDDRPLAGGHVPERHGSSEDPATVSAG